MPPVSVWFIRSALLSLLAGYFIGALLLTAKGVGVPSLPLVWRWLPVHYEVLLVGWLVQLVMGVAYWIFPRFGMTPQARGREDLAWLALALLNGGLWLDCFGSLQQQSFCSVAGRIAEVLSAACLAVNIWTRTRASGISPM